MMGDGNPMKCPDTAKKNGDARKGEKHPLFGKHLPEETRKKIIESTSGEKNYHWKGGLSFEPYCPKFTKEFKERVRAFFGYQCMECGHIWQQGEKKLSVHHVNFRKDACCSNDVIPMFVSLCSGSCHTKTNHNRPFWEYWFTEMINRLYGGKCYFTKEEMMIHV